MTEDKLQTTERTLAQLKNLHIRLTRTTAIELAVLAIVVVIAVLIRVQPIQYGAYFTAYDPLFQYRATEYVVENGYASWWTWHDDMSWYPLGRNVANSAYPGIPFSAAFVYNLITFFGANVTVYDVSLYFPLLMASLTCIATYYFAKDLKGKAAGAFAALFMAINPAFIRRTSLGFFDTENIGIFSMVLIGLFFLRSFDVKNRLEKRTVYGILSGLAFGYLFASWGAAKYMTGLIMLYMLMMVFTKKYETRHFISYALTIGIGFMIVMMVPRLGVNSLLKLDSLVAFGLVGLLVVYEYFKKNIDIKLVGNFAGLVVIIAIIAVFLLPAVGINIPITYKFLKVLNPFTSAENALYNSIAENHVVGWTSFFNNFGVIIVLAIFGAYYAMKNQDEKNLYLVIFFMTSLYFAGIMARLSQILAAPASLMGAYGLIELARPFIAIGTVTERPRSRRRRKAIYGVNKSLGVVFIAIVVISLIPNIYSALQTADNPTSLAASAIPYQFNGGYPTDWPDALAWLKANTTEDSIIVSWWDYGYWIEAMAERTTMADGATQTEKQIANIGNIMMSPQNESIILLERYGADYILVFHTFNPNNPQEEWGVGDEGKWTWMVEIGKLDINEYRNMTLQFAPPTQKFYDSTLARLMYMLPDFNYFQPVYVSEHGYVLIYEIIYPE